MIVHFPGVTLCGQLASTVHTNPEMLHVPGSVGHRPGLQPSPVIEQVWPKVGQFWIVQLAFEMLQVPASVGQLALDVHTRPDVEHAPGMSGH